MNYLHTKSLISVLNASLIIDIKSKSNYRFRAAAILFYSPQWKYLNNNCIYFGDTLPCSIKWCHYHVTTLYGRTSNFWIGGVADFSGKMLRPS